MRARIVKIGNSQGLRIPKPILEQTGITEDVEMEIDDHRIIIRPVSSVREGWDEAFGALAQSGDDQPLVEDEPLSHSWDEDEWRWS